MSTLGLSGAPDRSDGLFKNLFWPTIQNAQDADLAASRVLGVLRFGFHLGSYEFVWSNDQRWS